MHFISGNRLLIHSRKLFVQQMITTPVRNIRHARAIMQTRKVCVTGRGSPLLHFDWRKTVYKQTDHSKNFMLTNVFVFLEANCFRASMTVKYEFMNQTLHSNPCNKFTCSAHSLLSKGNPAWLLYYSPTHKESFFFLLHL